ncbi:laccase-14-like [Henckelia pumila]|uniref:laccase-14-like n=1 Tax=Henckelia pumila TaxID=405737 RepID=UPI003C6E4461
MKVFMILPLAIVVLLCSVPATDAAIRSYTFVLEDTVYTKLCENTTILTINGQSPGPTIVAKKGDLVIVDLINRANHSITIHWHGVKMPRYPWWDGPEFVTQCPIKPGQRFKYNIVLSDEEGTLWWHAHNDWSRATVYGALVILPKDGQSYPFPKPADEFPVLIGEWWKADIQEVMEEFLANGGDPNNSDAFLLNGQPGDLYPCSKQDTFKVTVEFGKTYLFRLVNSIMNNIMFFKIANHNITVVGSDASYTKPLNSDYITISPGQTIDFLLHANQIPSHYYMASRVYASSGIFDRGIPTGIIEYAGNYTPPTNLTVPDFFEFNDTGAAVAFTNQLKSLADKKHPVDVPQTVDKSLFFTLSVNTRNCSSNSSTSCVRSEGDRLLASVNNITLLLPHTSILNAYYYKIPGVYTKDFPESPLYKFNYTGEITSNLTDPQNGTRVLVLEHNTNVELVFQGTNIVGGIDHPMHLHGHSFYVVGSDLGNFNPDIHPKNYNLKDPPLMETIAVPRNGWTAIRFKANNPGVWFMHCHFERHVSWGMGMTFIIKNGKGGKARMAPPPRDMPKCT